MTYHLNYFMDYGRYLPYERLQPPLTTYHPTIQLNLQFPAHNLLSPPLLMNIFPNKDPLIFHSHLSLSSLRS